MAISGIPSASEGASLKIVVAFWRVNLSDGDKFGAGQEGSSGSLATLPTLRYLDLGFGKCGS
eukprot:5221588-Pyramimonas_sp.AAC.1